VIEIEIETFGSDPADEDTLHAFARALADVGAQGVVPSSGGIGGGIGASFAIRAPARGEPFSSGVRTALRMFDRACRAAGVTHEGVARVVILTPRMAELELAPTPESYLGAAEVAASLGVGRQRLAELRLRDDFPAPVAELASGPVWRGSTLLRFVATWDRRPGRRPSGRPAHA
jgi:hypothetical protein